MKVLLASMLLVLSLVALAAAVLDTEWESWKQEHGKKYQDDSTETKRYTIWKENLVKIEVHNKDADKHGYTLGMNEFGDLTAGEFFQTHNGFSMELVKTNSTREVFKYDPTVFKPAEDVDWRNKGAVTPVKTQGQCGSCWAWSTTGSLEGQHFLKTGQLVSLSEQNLIDCSEANYGNNRCKGGKGGLINNAFKYIIANGGIDTEESYPYQAHPYQAHDERCRFNSASIGATMSSYKDVEHGDVQALTAAVGSVGPISVAMDASHFSFQLYKAGVYSDRSCSSQKLDHGVLAVGYGTYEETKPYFLVKNSWGPTWGDQGYFKIARDDSNMCGLATQASYPIV